MKLCNIGHEFDYETEKLIRIFLPFEKIKVLHTEESDDKVAICRVEEYNDSVKVSSYLNLSGKSAQFCEILKLHKNAIESFEKICERTVATTLFECFVKISGYRPPWGILTGVRPARLFSRTVKALGRNEAIRRFSDDFKVSDTKISLCEEAYKGENAITELSRPESFSLYVSIPFCPSRCNYCSFVSHSVEKAGELIPDYVNHLCKEIEVTADIVRSIGLRLETVYVGGGTPTAISAELLEKVLSVSFRL